jgi:hypothetical protein
MLVSCRRSVARRGSVAARICPALEEAIAPVDANRRRVAHVVVPVGKDFHRLAAQLEFAQDLVGDASLQREIA